MATDWKAIQEEYETSNLTFKELSDKFGVKVPTIKAQKQRKGWERIDASLPQKKMQIQEDASEPDLVDINYMTEKQQRFCFHYIKSWNATISAIKAGYAKESAHVTGSQLLRNPKVYGEIKNLKEQMRHEMMIDAQDIVNMYLKIAMADITDYVRFGRNEETLIDEYTGEPLRFKNGKIRKRTYNYVDFEDWDKIDGTVVSEVSQGKDGIKVKLADRSKALEFLTKYFELVPDSYKDKIIEMKAEEIAIRKAEMESRTSPPDKPNIDNYLEALRGNIGAVFDDEEEE